MGAWALQLDFGGDIYRFATEPVSLIDSDGDVLVFEEGLVDFQSSASPDSIPMVVESIIDWEALWESGTPMEQQRATVWRVRDGVTRVADAQAILRGFAQGVRFAAPGVPGRLELTVAGRERTGGALMPSPSEVVSAETFPDATLDVVGASYPLVIGRPGVGIENGVWPGLMYADGADDRLVVARGPVQMTEVVVANEEDADTFPVIASTDAAGQPVAITDPIAGLGGGTANGRLRLSCTATGGGGLVDSTGRLVRGAGDVILELVSLYAPAIDIDTRRIRDALPILNRYAIDTVINKPTRSWEWIRSALLPILPVNERQGPDGRYLQPWTLYPRRTDAAHHLVEGVNCERASAPTLARDVLNDFTIAFARPLTGASARKRRRMCGDVACRGEPHTAVSRAARDSFLVHGALVAQPIETGVVFDEATADRILADRIARHAQPAYVVDYLVDAELDIREGQVVTLTGGRLEGRLGVVGVPLIGQARVRVPIEVLPLRRSVDTATEAERVQAAGLSWSYASGAYGRWDPYNEGPSNYTAGATNGWAQLSDQTGQGRHLTDTDDRPSPVTYDRPDATSAKYPGPDGATAHAMPLPSGSQQLLYDEDPGGDLESFAFVYAGPYDEAVSSTGSEYWLNQGSTSPSRLMSFRRSGGGTERVVDWSGSAGPIAGTAITIPGVGTGADSWLAYAIRATDTGVGYDYRVIALGDMGDGAGVVLFGDVTTTDSTAHSSTTATRRTRWRGVGLESESLHGIGSLWVAPAGQAAITDANLIESLLAAISTIGTDRAVAAAALI